MEQLQTLGYTEERAQEWLDTFLGQPQTGVIDIRFRPRSRWRPAWNQAALIQRYGATKYGHLPSLGNVNYVDRKLPIVLVAPDEGVVRVVRLLHQGFSLVLLCACKDYERCHRKIVYELVRSAWMGEEEERKEGPVLGGASR